MVVNLDPNREINSDTSVILNRKCVVKPTVLDDASHACNRSCNTIHIEPAVKMADIALIETAVDFQSKKKYETSEWYTSAMQIRQDWQTKPIDHMCAHVSMVGNWPVCFDSPFQIKPPCLVYSFGIAFDFSFDDGMRALGCEVHSFDPSMKVKDTVTKTGVYFHNMGLSHINDDNFSPRKDIYVGDEQTWKLRTLKNVLKELNHTGRTLDILKIDVESHEWEVVDNIMRDGLFKNVKQFMLEWHFFPDFPARSDFKRCSKIYKRLIDSGLKKYYTSEHQQTLEPFSFNLQADTAHVNLNFRHNVQRQLTRSSRTNQTSRQRHMVKAVPDWLSQTAH